MGHLPLLLAMLCPQLNAQEGEISVLLPPSATLQPFTPIKPGIAQLMVRGCPTDVADLEEALEDRSVRGIIDIEVRSLGSGSWYLVVQLSDRRSQLEAVVDSGRLHLRAGSGQAPPTPSLPPPSLSLDELFEDSEPSPPAVPLDLPLVFLQGEALTPALDPLSYQTLLPVYEPGAGTASWASIDDARQAYLESNDERERSLALYGLGWHYLKLGFSAESRYYFEQLQHHPGAFSPGTVAMIRARAALASAAWEDARKQLGLAHAAGASQEQVAEALALISLATGRPAREPMARLLLDTTGRPEAWLLAAELLQRAGAFETSLEPLEGLQARVLPEHRPWVALRQGDALSARREFVAARRAYNNAPPELSECRLLLLELLEHRPTFWPRAIPALGILARGDGYAAAEAIYLIAQIEETFQEVPGAMGDLKRLLRRFPQRFVSSDAPQRLWGLFNERLTGLKEQRRWIEMAALHEETWSRALSESVDDPAPLLLVADAYESLGLPEHARRVLRDAFHILGRENASNPGLVLRLAQLYVDSERYREALDTLAYLRSGEVPVQLRGRRELLRARAKDAAGDTDGATQALVVAARYDETREEAQLLLAMRDAEAGRCAQAIPSLRRQLMPEQQLARHKDPLPYLSLARCLMAEGLTEEAAEVAKQAAGRSTDPADARHAAYLALNDATSDDPEDTLLQESLAGDDIWAALKRDELDAAIFAEEIRSRED